MGWPAVEKVDASAAGASRGDRRASECGPPECRGLITPNSVPLPSKRQVLNLTADVYRGN
jgi:hypothetical protein